VHERLALGPHPGRRDPLAELVARERTVLGKRPLDGADPAFGVLGAHALLAKPAHVPGELGRRREREQPRVVLAADQVERAAVQPGDQERALLGERAVDVRGGEALAARAYRQPGAPWILPLNGEQPLGHCRGVARPRAGEELRREPRG
jgi:hypothetical protein